MGSEPPEYMVYRTLDRESHSTYWIERAEEEDGCEVEDADEEPPGQNLLGRRVARGGRILDGGRSGALLLPDANAKLPLHRLQVTCLSLFVK